MATRPSSYTRLELANIQNEETVYQRCLLVTGTYHDFSDTEDFITTKIKDNFHRPSPQQNWPAANGAFRCLLMLHAGPNKVDFELYHKGQLCSSTRITIQYQPLLQVPPLHLAILVARDSPLLMDCPQAKRGAITTAHCSLDSAVVKLRMAAYMWQALLAEDFRLRGLGRRTFRLEEEWSIDTTTSASLQCSSNSDRMGTVAKVHIVRIERTVAELRASHVALHNLFKQALELYGGPFLSSCSPVVAGMILDSHYSHDQGRILAHVAEAHHYPSHMSLGIFGSHTTYSWPRFLEEVPSCLLDTTPIGDAVANDHGQCSTMSDSCCVGQGGMLDQIRQAFGVEGTSQPWKSNFIASWSNAFIAQPSRLAWIPWDLSGALRMWRQAHFRLPSDKKLTSAEKETPLSLKAVLDEDSELCIEVMCMAGIARLRFRGRSTAKDIDFVKRDSKELDNTVTQGPSNYLLTSKVLSQELDRRSAVELEVLTMLGQSHKIRNIWGFLADQPFIKVPGTSLVLSKRSVKPEDLDESDLRSWALLLKKRSIHDPSELATADRIDIRVGGLMDGAVVYYSDGSRCNCGIPSQQSYGGHLSEDRTLSESEIFRITRVSVNTADQQLNGCRMTLPNNQSWGDINRYNVGDDVQHLVCGLDERIIGFFGKSVEGSGFMREFGIITAPRSVVDSEEGLPAAIYDMPELMNVYDGSIYSDSSDSEDD